MAKKIVPIYTEINDSTAERFAASVNDASRFGDDLEVRLSSNGGSPEQGWSVLSLMQDFTGVKTLGVDGRAYSMASFLPLYVDEATALDVSQFMFHRAGLWYEGTDMFNEVDQQRLDMINGHLKSQMKSKLDEDEFEKAFGITIDAMFEGERKDYFFDAKTAKKIGLISSIKKLDSVAKSDINALCRTMEIAAIYEDETPVNKDNLNTNKMTIQEVKANHPDVVKSIQEETIANVKAWQGFIDIDNVTATAGMLTGNAPTSAEIATMQANYIKAQKPETPEAPAEIAAVGADAGATEEATDVEEKNPYMAGIEAMHSKESKK